jgi:hypothetical protein
MVGPSPTMTQRGRSIIHLAGWYHAFSPTEYIHAAPDICWTAHRTEIYCLAAHPRGQGGECPRLWNTILNVMRGSADRQHDLHRSGPSLQ